MDGSSLRRFKRKPNGKSDFDAVTRAIGKKFEIVKKSKDAWAFRWRYTDTAASPVFTLTVGAGRELDRAVTKRAKAYALLSIDDLDVAHRRCERAHRSAERHSARDEAAVLPRLER